MSTPRIIPNSRPAWPRERVAEYLANAGLLYPVIIMGFRGYYLNSMGKPAVNDIGIYDDAIYVYSANVCASFNANTDPSRLRQRVAVLRTGLWKYKLGIHGISKPANRRYPALVQADEVTVDRHQAGSDTGWFGINIHRGGYSTTSSLGCQTIYPDQWNAFFNLVAAELNRAGQKVVPYLLVEQQG
jgi:lysozyme